MLTERAAVQIPEIQAPELLTLGQMTVGGSWKLELAHHRNRHMLVWVTRGQGRVLLDGSRRGVGAHNALFIPANDLTALDMGRGSAGQVLLLPVGSDVTLPERPQHLRVREMAGQAELTTLLETLGRELNGGRPLVHDAVQAYAGLTGVWLRRQMTICEEPERETAARRLSRSFCRRLVDKAGSGETMSDHAEALGVTPTHLTRVSKAQTGRTAAALLTEQQLYMARHLLTGTRAPVKNIAQSLGFGSAAYFTRFIQQHTGQSPLRLRRNG